MSFKTRFVLPLCFAVSAIAAGHTQAADIELPQTLAWTAYPTATIPYSQAVAIGGQLQKHLGVHLRVIPGRNDFSRLSPVRSGQAHFGAAGTEAVYAQEGMMDFASPDWGPLPLRLGMYAVSDGCAYTLLTAKDANIQHVADFKGKRIAWIKGAPSQAYAIRAMLAYANLGWDDVVKVEVSGYQAALEAILEDRADAMGSSCVSAAARQIEASPRGLRMTAFPHDDKQAVARVRNYLPWYVPHVSTVGATISKEQPLDGWAGPFPLLVTMAEQDADLVYNMVKAIHVYYDEFKTGAPGANGWSLDRQMFADTFVPYHSGAVRYFKEIGIWTPEAERRQQENLQRQKILKEAWDAYVAKAPSDPEAFAHGWMEARYAALTKAGMPTIARDW